MNYGIAIPGTLLALSAGAAWLAVAGGKREWNRSTAEARANLADGGISVPLDFFFGGDGSIHRAFTDSRYRDVDGKAVPTPWECRYGSYSVQGGVRVPMEAEVEWILPEGRLAYWKGAVRKAVFGLEPYPGGDL